MNNGEFSISYEQVESIANTLKSSANKMQSILEDVSAKMTEVYGDAWKSNASNEHMAEYNRIKAKFENFYGEVTKCSNYLTTVVETI